MASGNGQVETLEIRIDSNAAKTAKEDAAELENLQKRFDATTGALKQHEAALRRLQQGGVVNIQTARELKSKIEAEKNEIAAMTEKVHAAGSSFEKLSAQTRANQERTQEANKATLALADAFGGALVTSILAVEGAALLAVAALGKFVVESANLARTQNLAREAVTGSEEDARRLGTQVDALAMKVPMLRGKINDLAVDMRKGGLGGQTLVDTLNASAQAASALDDAAGAKVRELVDRGKTTGRFSLNALETKNTGLPQFQEVAAALAKNMKTSIADAQSALLEGRVALGDGAKALRDAVEKKFEKLNLAKMLDLDVMKAKLGELFQSLTSGVNLEPLLNALKDFFSLFDQSTVAGAALHKLVTVFGDTFINVVSKAMPLVKGFFEGLILVALDLYIAILKLQLKLQDAFGDSDLLSNIDLVETGVTAAKVAVIALAIAFGVLALATIAALTPLAIGMAVVLLPILLIVAAIYGLYVAITTIGDAVSEIDWKAIGKSILDGLSTAFTGIEDKGKELAAKLKKGFTDTLGIHSPSTVFAELGVNTVEGFNQGVASRAPSAADQLEAMATPKISGASGGGAGVQVTIAAGAVQVNIQVGSAKEAEALARSESFMGEMTRVAERLAISVGQKVAA